MGNIASGLIQAGGRSRHAWRSWFPVISAAAALLLILGGGGVAIAAAGMAGPPSAPNGYTLVGTIPLPGPAGHGDWVAYDPSNQYIYLSHHGSNVVVIDTKTNKVIANISSPDLNSPDVIAFSPKYVYVAAEKAGKIVVISKATWKIVGTATSKGPSPDGIFLDAAMGRLYVVSNDANRLEVYGAGNQPNLIATYPLEPAKPKSGPDVGILVPSKNTLFEPDDALVLAINLDTGQITRRLDTHLPITGNGATKGMVYDAKGDHLWVATTDKRVLVLNPDTFAMVKTLPATEADDQMGFDPGLRLIFAFGGHGFDVYNADTMAHIAYVNTGSGVTHTGAVDPATHQVYVYEGHANVLGVYARR
jgi:YVTN family beta-propeller protein